MKKTYIEPNIEVLFLDMQNIVATSVFGSDYFGKDTQDGETIEGD